MKRFVLIVVACVLALPVAADAGTTGPRVVARINVRPDGYAIESGLGAVWLVDSIEYNYSRLRRIDPATNKITATYQLDSSSGGFAVGAGSIWVSMYFDNTVERINTHGKVVARIRVGVQPQYVLVASGSVWVSNHHGRSVSRIDPKHNRVVATVSAGDQHMFRDGPQDLTTDGRYIYVGASNGTKPFERIDPRNDHVRTFANPSAFCGDIVYARNSVWSADHCNSTLYRIDPADGTVQRSRSFVDLTDAARLGHSLWISYDTALDQGTGVGSGGTIALLGPAATDAQTLVVGGDASELTNGFGDLWVVDNTHGTVTRVRP
jgi:streptogramin lyase